MRSRYWAEAGLLILGFPLFAAGYAFWFLPCFLPAWVNKKSGLYIGYSSTVKILLGMFTFPLALWGAGRLAHFLGASTPLAWLIAALTLPLAYGAEQYRDLYRRWTAARLALRLEAADLAALQALQNQRAIILQALGALH